MAADNYMGYLSDMTPLSAESASERLGDLYSAALHHTNPNNHVAGMSQTTKVRGDTNMMKAGLTYLVKMYYFAEEANTVIKEILPLKFVTELTMTVHTTKIIPTLPTPTAPLGIPGELQTREWSSKAKLTQYKDSFRMEIDYGRLQEGIQEASDKMQHIGRMNTFQASLLAIEEMIKQGKPPVNLNVMACKDYESYKKAVERVTAERWIGNRYKVGIYGVLDTDGQNMNHFAGASPTHVIFDPSKIAVMRRSSQFIDFSKAGEAGPDFLKGNTIGTMAGAKLVPVPVFPTDEIQFGQLSRTFKEGQYAFLQPEADQIRNARTGEYYYRLFDVTADAWKDLSESHVMSFVPMMEQIEMRKTEEQRMSILFAAGDAFFCAGDGNSTAIKALCATQTVGDGASGALTRYRFFRHRWAAIRQSLVSSSFGGSFKQSLLAFSRLVTSMFNLNSACVSPLGRDAQGMNLLVSTQFNGPFAATTYNAANGVLPSSLNIYSTGAGANWRPAAIPGISNWAISSRVLDAFCSGHLQDAPSKLVEGYKLVLAEFSQAVCSGLAANDPSEWNRSTFGWGNKLPENVRTWVHTHGRRADKMMAYLGYLGYPGATSPPNYATDTSSVYPKLAQFARDLAVYLGVEDARPYVASAVYYVEVTLLETQEHGRVLGATEARSFGNILIAGTRNIAAVKVAMDGAAFDAARQNYRWGAGVVGAAPNAGAAAATVNASWPTYGFVDAFHNPSENEALMENWMDAPNFTNANFDPANLPSPMMVVFASLLNFRVMFSLREECPDFVHWLASVTSTGVFGQEEDELAMQVLRRMGQVLPKTDKVFVTNLGKLYARLNGAVPLVKTYKDRKDTWHTKAVSGAPKLTNVLCAMSEFTKREGFLVKRPFETHKGTGVLVVHGGPELGMVGMTNPIITEGEDAPRGEQCWVTQMYQGAIVARPDFIIFRKDAYYNGFTGGVNVKFWPLAELDQFVGNNRFKVSTCDAPSMIVHPAAWVRVDVFMHTRIPRAFNGDTTVREEYPHAQYWSEFFGLESASSEFTNKDVDEGRGTIATTLMRMPRYYDTAHGERYLPGNTSHGQYGEMPGAKQARFFGNQPLEHLL